MNRRLFVVARERYRTGSPVYAPLVSQQLPLCPTCTQPGIQSMKEGFICRNEACPEYGQQLRADEPPPAREPSPTPLRD